MFSESYACAGGGVALGGVASEVPVVGTVGGFVVGCGLGALSDWLGQTQLNPEHWFEP